MCKNILRLGLCPQTHGNISKLQNTPNVLQLKRAFGLSIFRIEIAIEIDKGCSMLSKIETEIGKARSTMSIFMPIFVSIFLHEIDKLINIK
jgi:hypothetical protein